MSVSSDRVHHVGIAEARDQVGGLHVAAVDQLLERRDPRRLVRELDRADLLGRACATWPACVWFKQRHELAGVDQTRRVAARESTLVGRTVGSIIDIGDAELPPESDGFEPISATRSPFAPALLMPYIGLCGLLPVSLSERAQKIVPFTFARVAARRLRQHAAQERAVGVEAQAELGVRPGRRCSGVMFEGRPELRVALAGQQVELTAGTADQHVRAGDVRAAREVESR